mgnify:CR=1 FL=1
MSGSDVRDALPGIPAEYAAVPVLADQAGRSLSICVLVRKKPDPVAGHLVVLRDLVDGRVLLGCLLDAGGEGDLGPPERRLSVGGQPPGARTCTR